MSEGDLKQIIASDEEGSDVDDLSEAEKDI